MLQLLLVLLVTKSIALNGGVPTTPYQRVITSRATSHVITSHVITSRPRSTRQKNETRHHDFKAFLQSFSMKQRHLTFTVIACHRRHFCICRCSDGSLGIGKAWAQRPYLAAWHTCAIDTVRMKACVKLKRHMRPDR